jgi:rhodanese-related sulfurtransferase
MSNVIDSNLKRYIYQFSPLRDIAPKYHAKLAPALKLTSYTPKALITKHSKHSKLLHFLVEGSIEIRCSFENRYNLYPEDPRSQKPLEEQLQSRGTIKAITECKILTADLEKLNQLQGWSSDYAIFHLDEGELSLQNDTLIDDNFHGDWDNAFISSPLASSLPSSNIHQLLSQLEDITVQKGQTIIEDHARGDYFYIIKQGHAIVKTAENGPFKGKVFDLYPGNYFGDEALIADTIRNASVVMKSDGVLGRLNQELFNKLIKQQLVTPLTTQSQLATEVKIIDVRLPIEYKQGHEPESSNIPISSLRKKMNSLNKSMQYIISPANDTRSELATYLLKQAGFNACYSSEQKSTNLELTPQ